MAEAQGGQGSAATTGQQLASESEGRIATNQQRISVISNNAQTWQQRKRGRDEQVVMHTESQSRWIGQSYNRGQASGQSYNRGQVSGQASGQSYNRGQMFGQASGQSYNRGQVSGQSWNRGQASDNQSWNRGQSRYNSQPLSQQWTGNFTGPRGNNQYGNDQYNGHRPQHPISNLYPYVTPVGRNWGAHPDPPQQRNAPRQYHDQYEYPPNQTYDYSQYQPYYPEQNYFHSQQQIPPQHNFGIFESRGWNNQFNTNNNLVTPSRSLSTEVFPRDWEQIEKSDGANPGVQISVMCYNVLAPTLQKDHHYLYYDCDPQAVKWSYRKRCFHKEIEFYRPDIVCLQEVEGNLHEDYNNFFQKIGYKGLFKKRTGEKCDGCAIYYSDDKFNLVDSISVEYFQKSVPLLNRDNVGLLVKLETKCDKGYKFVVATTHLLFNLKRVDVKIAQGMLLLAELDRLACYGVDENGIPLYYPTIVTGDFNSESTQAVPRLFCDGKIFADRKFVSGEDVQTISSRLGVIQLCQHYGVLEQRSSTECADYEFHTSESAAYISLDASTHHAQDKNPRNSTKATISNLSIKKSAVLQQRSDTNARAGDDEPNRFTHGNMHISHNFNFKDVYLADENNQKYEDSYVTTKQNNWVRVDYIFYSTDNASESKEGSPSLKLLRRLKLPTQRECKKIGRIPREGVSSDHFPLIAEFLLTSPR